MEQLTGIFKNFLAAILVIASLPSLTWASNILVDDNNKIYSYYVPATIPATGTVFSSSGGSQVTGMAVTYSDTAIPTSPFEVLVAAGTSVYAYSSVAAQSTFIAGVNPVGLAVDSYGNVYTAVGGTTIDEFAPTGGSTPAKTIATAPNGYQVDSILADGAGDLYVAEENINNSSINSITEYLVSGATRSIAQDLSGDNLAGMAFDGSGNLFVTYQNINSNPDGTFSGGIFEITPGGQQSTFYSSTSIDPTSLGFDYAGDLYLLFINSALGNTGGIDVFTSQAPGTQPGSFATGLYQPAGFVQLAPEPGTTMLLTGGLIGLVVLQRSRRSRA